jgi:hypothetical protein
MPIAPLENSNDSQLKQITMDTRTRMFLPAAAIGLALACSPAHAQLLSGNTTGSFVDLGEANTTVVNASDGSSASFSTGIPAPGSSQSEISFTNASFIDVSSGDPIQVGLFVIHNGMTELGSGAETAQFNLGLDLTSPTMESFVLSTISFAIDHTPNTPGAVPDTFSVAFTDPAPKHIGDWLVQFHIHFDPKDIVVAENATVQKGDVTVTFSAVPEPSVYASTGALLLVGVAGFRRLRNARGLPISAAAA